MHSIQTDAYEEREVLLLHTVGLEYNPTFSYFDSLINQTSC